MNTMTTLSGGLVAVFALYVLGGAIRNLPPMLRARKSEIRQAEKETLVQLLSK